MDEQCHSADVTTASTWRFEVMPCDAGKRLDVFAVACLAEHDVSREKVKRAIRDGGCLLDGIPCTKARQPLEVGQRVELTFQLQENPGAALGLLATAGQPFALPIVYEDEHLVVINKPAGLTVHPCPSTHQEVTLVHHLLARYPELGASPVTGAEGLRPGIVHRLDKDTSGLMIVALTEQARLRLSAAFAAHEVRKIYWALVRGVPPAEGRVEASIARHPTYKTRMAVSKLGKEALSHYWLALADAERRFALMLVEIHTGRTHQIRVHMEHIGHPLWGDAVYGPVRSEGTDPAQRQMLHAGFLAFTHPFTGEKLAFTLPPPVEMLDVALALTERTQRVVVTGGAGCGKSALLDAYRTLGLPVWQADRFVAQQYEPHAEAWAVFRQRYGDLFIADDHSPVDKQLLATAMVERSELKREVETVVHALVRADLEKFWRRCEENGDAVAVAEVPLWFETRWGDHGPSGADTSVLVVGVGCDENVRVSRLHEKRGWSPERIAAIEAWQWPLAEKLKRCQIVIMNNGSLVELEQQAKDSLVVFAKHVQMQQEAFATSWKTACELARQRFM